MIETLIPSIPSHSFCVMYQFSVVLAIIDSFAMLEHAMQYIILPSA